MKKAQQVVDIQKKIEILKVKKEYINDILKEADCGRKNNLDSLTELEYMDKISLLEAEVNKIKNYGLQSSLIKQIQINDKLQTSIFKLKRQVCLLSSVRNKTSQIKKLKKKLIQGKEKNENQINQIIFHTKNLKNYIDLENYARNQATDDQAQKTIESLVAEEINQKMKEIQANWEKENKIKKYNKISRLMRVSLIENDNHIKNYAEELKNLKTEVDSLTSYLKQNFEVAAKSCYIKKKQYESKKTNLETQIKNLKKNEDYKKLENILSDLTKENYKLGKIEFKQYRLINRYKLKYSYEFLFDLEKKILINIYEN
ncbi:hypothetical protein C2G38_2191838 [Gigaspora rosea]|uniref:Uncharacterized protein n=1 Tax=Gigaspora rosea TaxID=44941 RepID=A0A397V8S8_9GLOM|nr:hypothetical protein C2G38_2191838 [Gigaspora rosea]